MSNAEVNQRYLMEGARAFLDSEEFDSTMYAYRTASSYRPDQVAERFEAVKKLILEFLGGEEEPRKRG